MNLIKKIYSRIRKILWRVILLNAYLSDYRKFYRHSGIRNKDGIYYKVLMDLHRIEKGLSLPYVRRDFGKEPLHNLTKHTSYIKNNVYLSNYASSLMTSYLGYVDDKDMIDKVNALISVSKANITAGVKKYPEYTKSILLKRKSVRQYSENIIPDDILENVINLAQYCPSVCNRQPWKVFFYNEKNKIDELLELQNGNIGFRSNIHNLAIITVDYEAFNIIGERNQLFIDGGMFLMTFCIALEELGLSSCCLNWAVEPKNDARLKALSGINENYRVISYVAFGYASENAKVAISPRGGE